MCWFNDTVTRILNGAEPFLLFLRPPVFTAVTSQNVCCGTLIMTVAILPEGELSDSHWVQLRLEVCFYVQFSAKMYLKLTGVKK